MMGFSLRPQGGALNFAALMRSLLACILWIAVLVGLQGRALATDPCEMIVAMHEQEHSGHHHDSGKPCDPSHDDHCPLEHHQHGNCSHAMPMATESHTPARLGGFGFSLSPICSEAQLPPDGPCADLDKPPLI